jgi:hypothetical protein
LGKSRPVIGGALSLPIYTLALILSFLSNALGAVAAKGAR